MFRSSGSSKMGTILLLILLVLLILYFVPSFRAAVIGFIGGGGQP